MDEKKIPSETQRSKTSGRHRRSRSSTRGPSQNRGSASSLRRSQRKLAYGLAIGVGIGAVIGLGIDNIAIGIGVGMALGVAFGTLMAG